ncbi:MAG: substrate-binding domain-containing protein [Alphaproteobacteria bacterium]|nr:substrate-binding domain-containing protein [Alphaproteobacteria bacterium]
MPTVPKLRRALLQAIGVTAAILCAPAAAWPEEATIGGTGGALGLARALGADFSAASPADNLKVLPSLGSTGAMRALLDGAIDLGLSARPLEPAEAARGAREVACVRTPLAFVSSLESARAIEVARLPALFADPRPTWPDGSPLRIILRTRLDADTNYLISVVPGLSAAVEAARRRPESPSAATDQDNMELAAMVPGSLTQATLVQLVTEGIKLRVLAVNGIMPSVETLESGRYPLVRRLCIIAGQSVSGVAQRFVSHVLSQRGASILRESGGLPTPVSAR